jgi:hypothetical protein
VALVDLARRGVHPPELMPFSTPWTDTPPEALPLRFTQYHWGNRASFRAEQWTLDLAVVWDGVVVGTQGFMTRDCLVTRSGETGSWLGWAHQGRGIGTRMRGDLRLPVRSSWRAGDQVGSVRRQSSVARRQPRGRLPTEWHPSHGPAPG